mgnify:CR=1 FL=1
MSLQLFLTEMLRNFEVKPEICGILATFLAIEAQIDLVLSELCTVTGPTVVQSFICKLFFYFKLAATVVEREEK